MFPQAERFEKWLRRRGPHAATPVHYTRDLKLFFAWASKPPSAITLHDVDAYIDRCHRLSHAIATVNRRLAAIHTFYHFLQTESGDAPFNPVLPRRHLIPSLLPTRSVVHFWQYPRGVNAMRKRKLLLKALSSPQNLRFKEMVALVEAFGFRLSRVKGSHHIFVHPDVRELINIQDVGGQAKPYQVRQFLKLVERYNLELGDEE